MSRTALVTGAASGMGLAIAHELVGRGDRVALLDRNAEGVEQVADGLLAAGGKVVAVPVDVGERASVDEAVARTRAELGPIEIVVTAAGIAPHRFFSDITLDIWEQVIRVNLTGTFNCIQAALDDMVAGSWGRVVTVSSFAGQAGAPKMADYSAAKGGVISLTRALAKELASKGITVNSISPGTIDTPMFRSEPTEGDTVDAERVAAMVPAKRLGSAEEIAATCAFLTSEGAGYVTGQIVGVNGGLY
jgi:2-hydroxycyclohexanecarboxyl-CoA dehydrogenase